MASLADISRQAGVSIATASRVLVKRTSRIIGVIVGDIVDPYFAEIARGVEDVAARVGHLTMVCNADRRPEAELAHRRIAFVEGPPGLHTSAHRLEGFRAAIEAGGGEPVVVPGGFEFEAGAPPGPGGVGG